MVENRMTNSTTPAAADHPSSRLDKARHAVSDAAHRVRERASDAAHSAGERASHAVDKRKDRMASRLSRIATSMRDASHCFSDNDETGVGHYVELAADRLEEAGDYLQEHPFDELRHEAAMFMRRHPEIGLAGAFIGGILLGRFLRASSRSESDEAEYGYAGDDWNGDSNWDDEEYAGSSTGSSFASAGAARASYGPGSGVIVQSSDVMSSGPTAPGHAMAPGRTDDRGRAESHGSTAASARAPGSASASPRSDAGGAACDL